MDLKNKEEFLLQIFKLVLKSLTIGGGLLMLAFSPQPVCAQNLTVRSETISLQKQLLVQEKWESYVVDTEYL